MRENRASSAPPATAGARSTGGPWPGLLGGFDVLGTVHLLTGQVPARELGDRLHRLLQEQGDILAGASELPSGRGVTVRIVGRRVEPVSAAVHKAVAAARAAILDGS